MIVRQVSHGSTEWHATVELRDKVLRRPLGMALNAQELADQRDAVHLAAYDEYNGALVGTLLLQEADNQILQMRQVAVDSARQRSGAGRALVHRAEQFAREQGYSRIILHAREAAIAFYEKLGYQAQGPMFPELGIPHVLMTKDL